MYEDDLVNPRKPVTFLGDARDMQRLDKLVKKLKKKGHRVSMSRLLRQFVSDGLKKEGG